MDLDERYLVLAMRLGRLAPELVDSYSGSRELAARVGEQPPPTPEQLREEARELRVAAQTETDDAARRRWLAAQLDAIETACAVLDGERIGYRELVHRCHGVRTTPAPEEGFAAAHERLRDALPGPGGARDRYERWLAGQEVPAGILLDALTTLAEALRARTRAAFGLPDGERVDFALVSGKRWAGRADHRGDLCTGIEINTDRPIHAHRLLELVAHEAYPGHHCEHVCKEAALVRDRGYQEASVFLYPTPQALVAEGIAQVGLECVMGVGAEVVAAESLRPLGIVFDCEGARVVRAVREALAPIRPNLAILLDEHGASPDEARAYARRWMLESDDHVDRAVEAVAARAWPPYESCYPEGLRLCRAFAAREPDGFQRLLAEQITTSDLIG